MISVMMEQARRRLSLILDDNSVDEENATYEYSLFNYKPRFTDMRSPLSASVNQISGSREANIKNKTRSSLTLTSSASFSSSSSSIVNVEELENYVIPRDVQKLKSRTKSFSPGSALTKYDMIKQKYQSRQQHLTNKSRATTASLSTASSSSSSSISSSSPRSSSHIESEAETETFWNRYKRQAEKKHSLGKMIKRAMSMNVKKRPDVRIKPRRKLDHDDIISAEHTPEEDLYDDLYTETYQDVLFHEQQDKEDNRVKVKRQFNQKSKLIHLKHRSVSEMIL